MGLIEPQRFHFDDDFVLQLLVFALLRGRQRFALQLVRNILLLQAAQFLVLAGDLVEGFHHLRLQLGLDGGERHLVFELVVVDIAVGGGLARFLFLRVAGGGGGGGGAARGGGGGGGGGGR